MHKSRGKITQFFHYFISIVVRGLFKTFIVITKLYQNVITGGMILFFGRVTFFKENIHDINTYVI